MRTLKAIALDVDGVLTDGGVWWGPDGAEWKRFCFADIMGVSLARKAGLIVTLISGEDSPLVDRFADKMKLADITKGCKDKAAALAAFAERQCLRLDEICFMGDDVNDLAAMKLAGVSACACRCPRGRAARGRYRNRSRRRQRRGERVGGFGYCRGSASAQKTRAPGVDSERFRPRNPPLTVDKRPWFSDVV